jgi:putative endonuclease
MAAFIYILECSDSTYYTGSTINIDKRLLEHQSGYGANYTKQRRPIKLVYYEEFQSVKEAFQREKQIQGWNKKKENSFDKRSI